MKKILAILLALAMILSFAACGETKKEEAAPKKISTGKDSYETSINKQIEAEKTKNDTSSSLDFAAILDKALLLIDNNFCTSAIPVCSFSLDVETSIFVVEELLLLLIFSFAVAYVLNSSSTVRFVEIIVFVAFIDYIIVNLQPMSNDSK